jgi:hypothetical protein
MATATAKKDDGLVHGVLRAKIKESAVDAALEKLDIHPAKATKIEGKVELLVEHFKTVSDDLVADCDKCRGASDPDAVPFCPFCGDGDDGAAAVGDPPEEGGGEDVGVPEEDGDAEEPGDGEDPPAPAAVVPESPASKDQKLVKKERAKKAPKAEKAEKPTVPPPESAPVKKDALAKKGDAAVALSDADAQRILDADVAEVRSLDRELNTYNWRLAQKLIEIGNSEHWKYRKTAEGKVAYRTFEEFANAELDITREYAQTLMRVGLRFKEKEVVELGVTKLRAVLNAPVQKQEEAFKRLKEGASRREVEKFTVKKAKEKKQSAGAAERAPKGGTSQITVATMLGKQTVALFKKPDGKRGSEDVPAKRLADAPWGMIDLANDVRMWFTVLANKKGELVLKLETKRAVPDEK